MNTTLPYTVPLLNDRRGTLCGERVNLHDYIRDPNKQRQILKELEKIKINVKYEFDENPENPQSKLIQYF